MTRQDLFAATATTLASLTPSDLADLLAHIEPLACSAANLRSAYGRALPKKELLALLSFGCGLDSEFPLTTGYRTKTALKDLVMDGAEVRGRLSEQGAVCGDLTTARGGGFLVVWT